MRIVLGIVALGVIFLGLWLIATSAPEPKPEAVTAARAISAPQQTAANPVMLGTALLVGGVLFFLMILRRR
jgi:hypothetical protein